MRGNTYVGNMYGRKHERPKHVAEGFSPECPEGGLKPSATYTAL